MNDVKKRYFEWMESYAINEKMQRIFPYKKLLAYLYSRDFGYIIAMDENRYADGIDLRYRFGMEEGIDDRIISSELDDKPCSILEMMLALSIRIEESIMSNSIIGDRTSKWFWEMIMNLGLGQMTDKYFDEEKAAYICDRFLDRKYERNGKGGLFTIYRRPEDMRDVEIWYQAMWYLSELDD